MDRDAGGIGRRGLCSRNESDEQEDEAQLFFEALREKEKKAIQVDAQEPSVFHDAVNEADDLSEGAQIDTAAEAPAFDWTDFAFDADEFDDTPTREELAQQVRTTDRISRRERAQQQAIEVGREFGWNVFHSPMFPAVQSLVWKSRMSRVLVCAGRSERAKWLN